MDKKNIPLPKKRELLVSRISKIKNELTIGTMTSEIASLQFTKITELYNRYDNIIDDLELTDSENVEVAKADEVRTLYYELHARLIPKQANVNLHNNSLPNASNATFTEVQRLAKLPTAELPTFDGNFENWLSFKNSFKTFIDKRTDIDKLTKFTYLRASLRGTASNKLALYDVSEENYDNAWKLLEDTYQKERPLVYKHYDALLNIESITSPTHENLTKLIDDARQHLNDLNTLKVKPTESLIVRILERKLPLDLRDKWEETFTEDKTLPDFEAFSKFIIRTAFKLSTRKIEQPTNAIQTPKRKRFDRTGNANKVQKGEPTTRALVTSTVGPCIRCKGPHPLYMCQSFKGLTVNQRVDFAKENKLCPNCLRQHKGACSSIKCKICSKFHHTLLHYPKTVTHQHTNVHSNKNNSKSETQNPTAAPNKDQPT